MELNPQIFTGKYESGIWTWYQFPRIMNDDKIFYCKCEGIEDKGKVKNIYTETYADSGVVRTDMPSEITREATDVTLTLAVARRDRFNQDSFSAIVDYFSEGLTVFWDNIRRKAAVLLLQDGAKPSKDTYLGMNYIAADIKFSNIAGESTFIEDTFENGHLYNVEERMLTIITKALS